MLAYEQIKANIETLKRRVSDVVAKCGRSDEIAIVAATKTQPKELIDFIEQNKLLSDVGENRVQELLDKYDDYHKDGCEINFIGHLLLFHIFYLIYLIYLILRFLEFFHCYMAYCLLIFLSLLLRFHFLIFSPFVLELDVVINLLL